MKAKPSPTPRRAARVSAKKPAPAAVSVTEVAAVTFPIVGLGASAGGLEAIEQFLGGVPADCGTAFVPPVQTRH